MSPISYLKKYVRDLFWFLQQAVVLKEEDREEEQGEDGHQHVPLLFEMEKEQSGGSQQGAGAVEPAGGHQHVDRFFQPGVVGVPGGIYPEQVKIEGDKPSCYQRAPARIGIDGFFVDKADDHQRDAYKKSPLGDEHGEIKFLGLHGRRSLRYPNLRMQINKISRK